MVTLDKTDSLEQIAFCRSVYADIEGRSGGGPAQAQAVNSCHVCDPCGTATEENESGIFN